ncbi:hypothetical protein EK21DRAFT_103671 [Setomelanomma holmii]|uniref:2-hydroxyacyl-CoA lyase n=1 Tax=Setomelanomma holmii TaxID=210430 RepID=A0A9P4LJ74_9PLEO|nr:hypothetical protein EK21DRAFT_103671 [Setomelanomma holmii]
MSSTSQSPATGAKIIAETLRDLGVSVIFGLVGVPVSDVAEQAINIGIRFIGFRNEQAASYAATAYGYLSRRPGVCLVVGGPGVLHAIAGVGNASENNFPLLLLGGSVETHQVTKGAFQELDSIALLKPHTEIAETPTVASLPRSGTDEARLARVAFLIKNAKAPLVLIGKGAAYARAENSIRAFIEQTSIPFLPSPMGKGVNTDSHSANASSARSAALKMADVVIILGARLNWIFHYGEAPKWSSSAKFVQVDISAEEMGRNAADAEYSLLGDVDLVTQQLSKCLGNWRYDSASSQYVHNLEIAQRKNERVSLVAAKDNSMPLTYGRVFDVIKSALHSLSPPSEGGICYIAKGANTTDISRSIFPLQHPRLRLDAGTCATMGASSGPAKRKKIVAIEGDSAFGFSGMEVETMARIGMDILNFVVNNGGIYFGDSNTAEDWVAKHEKTKRNESGLRSWALGWEVKYQKMAEACGGLDFLVRTPEELKKATIAGFNATVPVIVNVLIQSGKAEKASFGWQVAPKKRSKKANL